MTTSSIDHRLAATDWSLISRTLDAEGWAVIPDLLSADECAALTQLYDHGKFRSKVVMARHGFGRGEYQYFAYSLPDLVTALRTGIYPLLAPIANRWYRSMGIDVQFPDCHSAFIERCHQMGQTRPTPLLLRYGKDDYNCLHQDIYGEQLFPLQLAVLLSQPVVDFQGGELVLSEQRPRMQSRASVVPLTQGDAVVFAVNQRPVAGTRGTYRVTQRHGVSKITDGQRHALGIIFHDAA